MIETIKLARVFKFKAEKLHDMDKLERIGIYLGKKLSERYKDAIKGKVSVGYHHDDYVKNVVSIVYSFFIPKNKN